MSSEGPLFSLPWLVVLLHSPPAHFELHPPLTTRVYAEHACDGLLWALSFPDADAGSGLPAAGGPGHHRWVCILRQTQPGSLAFPKAPLAWQRCPSLVCRSFCLACPPSATNDVSEPFGPTACLCHCLLDPLLPRFPVMSVFLDPRQDLAEVSCLDIGVGPYNNPGPRGSGNYGRGPCPGHCGAALHTRTVTDHVAHTA